MQGSLMAGHDWDVAYRFLEGDPEDLKVQVMSIYGVADIDKAAEEAHFSLGVSGQSYEILAAWRTDLVAEIAMAREELR